jgi:hypothetical protein
MGTATIQDCGKLHQTPTEHETEVTVLYLNTSSLVWDYHPAIKILQQNEMLNDRTSFYIIHLEKLLYFNSKNC